MVHAVQDDDSREMSSSCIVVETIGKHLVGVAKTRIPDEKRTCNDVISTPLTSLTY